MVSTFSEHENGNKLDDMIRHLPRGLRLRKCHPKRPSGHPSRRDNPAFVRELAHLSELGSIPSRTAGDNAMTNSLCSGQTRVPNRLSCLLLSVSQRWVLFWQVGKQKERKAGVAKSKT